MSVTRDIVDSYRAPRRVLRRLMDGPENEARALIYLVLGCGLIFIAQWPRLSREAFFDPSIPLEARIGGALLGWIFIAPLALYLIAGTTHLVASIFRLKSTGYRARLALFWAVLAASPLWLLYGLASGFLGQGGQLTLLGFPAFAAFIIFWGLGLREAISSSPLETPGETP